jgi:hypothetical protein
MGETQPVTMETVRQVVLALPEVEERTVFGTPAFYVRKKFMGRVRDDGDTFVIRVDELERDVLLQAEPDIYYLTDHYVGYPYILVRLSKANGDDLARLLAAAWRLIAPKRVIKAYDHPG